MKLFIYELKKNIFRVSLLVLTVILMAVNIYKAMEERRFFGETRAAAAMTDYFGGELNEEKFAELAEYRTRMEQEANVIEGSEEIEYDYERYITGTAAGDASYAESDIKPKMEYAYLYRNTVLDYLALADENIAFYDGKNSYETSYAQLAKQLYGGRIIKSLGQYNTPRLYFDYEFSTLAVIILVIFIFSSAFSSERATGTDRIIISNKRSGSVFWAKHFTLYLFAAAAVILFSVSDIIVFAQKYGIGTLDQPLFAIQEYQFTPLNVTVLGVMLITLVLRILAVLFVGEVIMVVSTVTKNIGACIALSFGVVGALVFISEFIDPYLSPINLVNTRSMFKNLDCYDIFGTAVPCQLITLLIAAALILALHVICYLRAVPRRLKEADK